MKSNEPVREVRTNNSEILTPESKQEISVEIKDGKIQKIPWFQVSNTKNRCSKVINQIQCLSKQSLTPNDKWMSHVAPFFSVSM